MSYIAYCCKCGKQLVKTSEKAKTDFAWSRNPILGTHFICEDCFDAAFADVAEDDLWNAVDLACRTCNVAFLPEQWTRIYEDFSMLPPVKAHGPAIRRYLALVRDAATYRSIDWGPQNEHWREIVADETRQEELHSAFQDEERKRLKYKWGEAYSDYDLHKLEDMYRGIVNSYGVGDEVGEDNARKLCMLSLEIDKCIASGGAGLDKLITPYNKLQDNAGFTADNTRDANSFESMSELMLYMEKTGWTKKFATVETQDIVDATIKDIQAHNMRLYRTESTIPDQIEEKLAAKRRIDELENRLKDEDLEAHFDESWRADDGILFPNEEEELAGMSDNDDFKLDLGEDD